MGIHRDLVRQGVAGQRRAFRVRPGRKRHDVEAFQLLGGGLDGITETVFKDVVGEVPTRDLDKAKLAGAGTPIIDLLHHAGLGSSKGSARKDLEAGGIYLNSVRVTDHARPVTTGDLLFGKYLLLRKGKRTYAVLEVRD